MTMAFANHIQLGRSGKHLNKSELARRIGVTPQYMADIEKGNIPSEEIIMKLVEALELDERETFKLADKIPPYLYERVKQEYYNGG